MNRVVDEFVYAATVFNPYRSVRKVSIFGSARVRVEGLRAARGLERDPADCSLRSQLLYATVGTTAAEADRCVLLVGVFRTELYDSVWGEKNLEDYLEFMKAVGATEVAGIDGAEHVHEVSVGGRELVSLYCYLE